jgi:hypothetical protein
MNPNVKSIKRALTHGALTLTTLALFGAPDLVRADVVVAAHPACATTDPFATLEAVGSCANGENTYSNFVIQSSNATVEDLSDSIVDGGNIATGFSFEMANFFATSKSAVDMTVGFGVMAPAATISSVQVISVGATFNRGVASIEEFVGLSGTIVGYPSQDTGTLTTTSSGAPLSGNIDFASAIGNGGFAGIPNFIGTVDRIVIPKPTFYVALVAGLAVTFAYARRRKHAA